MTTWEETCERARIAASDLDNNRWTLGDIACEVVTEYGKDSVGELAKECNIGKRSLQEYRATSAKFADFAYVRTIENLAWSHFNLARRIDDIEEALSFIHDASANGWTVDEAKHHYRERYSKSQDVQKWKLSGTVFQDERGAVCVLLVDTDNMPPAGMQVKVTLTQTP
jgi:hypothetical protein